MGKHGPHSDVLHILKVQSLDQPDQFLYRQTYKLQVQW